MIAGPGGVLRHYLELALLRAGVRVDPDMRLELEALEETFDRVDAYVRAAVAERRASLDSAERTELELAAREAQGDALEAEARHPEREVDE